MHALYRISCMHAYILMDSAIIDAWLYTCKIIIVYYPWINVMIVALPKSFFIPTAEARSTYLDSVIDSFQIGGLTPP